VTAGGPEDRALRPFDVGLQPERTALAWRRTTLAIAVGALVAIRVLPELLGAWVLLPATGGLLAAFGAAVASHRRYGAHHHLLTGFDSDRIALPDGRLLAVVAAVVVLGGVGALLVVTAAP